MGLPRRDGCMQRARFPRRGSYCKTQKRIWPSNWSDCYDEGEIGVQNNLMLVDHQLPGEPNKRVVFGSFLLYDTEMADLTPRMRLVFAAHKMHSTLLVVDCQHL